MVFNVGNIVTRKSYNNDTIFKIVNIVDDIAYLKGINVRLYADSMLDDLVINNNKEDVILNEDNERINEFKKNFNLDRDEFFYLPGKILHIDGDKDYLERCLKFYKNSNILAYGVFSNEEDIEKNIKKYLDDTNADIVVITGHDAFYKKKGSKNDNKSYKNSENFIKAIKEARKYEKAHDKLIIIAGACQSNYEELIKSGANFASSPKRINIHALDPAIIATTICLSEKGEDIDLLNLLSKTKYGPDGIGGIKTKGTMYVGYPR